MVRGNLISLLNMHIICCTIPHDLVYNFTFTIADKKGIVTLEELVIFLL